MFPARVQTRRDLLRSSLAGVVAAEALTGCGSVAHHSHRVPKPVQTHDVDVLNGVLATEQRSIAYYIAVTPLLSGSNHRAASTFLRQDLLHSGIIDKLITAAGGQSRRPDSAYPLPSSTRPAAILSEVQTLEDEQIRAYVHAIPLLSSAEVRQSMASLLANDAQHVAVIRAQQGLSPLTGPFVVGP
jgi:Ferritin-like domain